MRRHATAGAGEVNVGGAPTGRAPPAAWGRALPSAPVIPERFQPLVDATAELAERFDDAGHRLYLVGGSVRDVFVGPVGTGPVPGRPDAGAEDSISPPTPSRRDREDRGGLGRRGLAAGQALRDRRCRARRTGASRSRRTGPRPTARTRASPRCVSATRSRLDLSRRDFTVNAMALQPARARARRPLRRARGPGGHRACGRRSTPRSPSATTRCGCCGPPGSSPATGSSPTPLSSTPCAAMHDRLAIVSAERIRDELDKLARGCPRRRPGCGSWSTPGWPSSSSPSCPALALEQDPIHRHKDVLAHTLAVVDKTQRRTGCCAWPRCSTTSASPARGRSARAG